MIIKSSIPRLFGAAGLTVWPFIFMLDPSDPALVAHEQVHYAEQRNWLVLPWWVMYLLSKSFRQAAEVRAYKVQIAAGTPAERCAQWLSSNYRLGITAQQALELLA